MGSKIHRNSLKPGHKVLWYEIKEVLGQGGFGITYLAYDPNLKTNVAIKEYLPIELAVRERDHSVHPVSEERGEQYKWGLDRFIKEAQTLAQFDHPNIVRVHSVTEENNTAYMVMAFEHGQTLQEKLKGKKTLEESELLKILIPILGGLEQIHNAGFIHRDIKPDNIFIRADGSPVLLDFGSARQALCEQTKTLTSLITPGYAPFEQYFSKSDEQGEYTDIYGLGATLYRAISGVPPMDAADRSNAIIKSKDTLVSAVEIGEGRYSERFLKAIDHAIQFRQEDRPQTIKEWKSEFDLPEDPIKEAAAIEQKVTQPGKTVLARQQKTKTKSIITIALAMLIVSITLALYFVGNTIVSDWQQEKEDEIARQLKAEDEQRLAILEQKRLEQEEAQRLAEEKKRLEDETERQRIEEEEKHLAELEQQRQEAEAKRLAEVERKEQEAERIALEEEKQRAAVLEKKRLAELEKQRQEEQKRIEEEKQNKAKRMSDIAMLLRKDPSDKWLIDNKTGCGTWGHNIPDGVTITWSGECVDGMASGKGISQVNKNHKPYSKTEGEMKNGMLNGQVIITYTNGERYEGEYRDGYMNGRGVFTSAEGRYEGEWRDGFQNGQGITTYTNGERHEGEYRDGKKKWPRHYYLYKWRTTRRRI